MINARLIMEQKDIDKLLKARDIIDKHKKRDIKLEDDIKHTKLTIKMIDDLKKLGFNSLEEFSEFNFDMNRQGFEDARPIEGECDKCAGYNGTPPCVLIWGDRACFYRSGGMSRESIMRSFWIAFNQHTDGISYSGNKKQLVCRDGHGYYCDLDKIKDYKFDVNWKINA